MVSERECPSRAAVNHLLPQLHLSLLCVMHVLRGEGHSAERRRPPGSPKGWESQRPFSFPVALRVHWEINRPLTHEVKFAKCHYPRRRWQVPCHKRDRGDDIIDSGMAKMRRLPDSHKRGWTQGSTSWSSISLEWRKGESLMMMSSGWGSLEGKAKCRSFNEAYAGIILHSAC